MAALAIGLGACQPEIDDVAAPDKGTADFSKYVALGNSLTAGYADGALYAEAQENSFPAILARQLQAVGGATEFKQPLVPAGQSIGVQDDGSSLGRLVLVVNPATGAPGPFRVAGLPTPNFVGAPLPQGPFSNAGIPGASSFHLVAPGYGNPANLPAGLANPYFARIIAQSGLDPNTTVAAYAAMQNPTFVTLWIGNNDVLSYATNGGAAGSSITPQGTFDVGLNGTIATLKAGNPNIKGAIANIPDVTDIPFFNRIPWNGFALDQAKADQLNAFVEDTVKKVVRLGLAFQRVQSGQSPNLAAALDYLDNNPIGQATLNGAFDLTKAQFTSDGLYPSFKAGANGFLAVVDTSISPLGVKQLEADEKVLLSASPLLGLPSFAAFPILPDQVVLDRSELGTIESARQGYNAKIKSLSDQHSLAFVDAAGLLKRINGGQTIDGITYSSTFVTGGVFSLDGVHLTQRGYAIIANEFIRSINSAYGANVPQTSPSLYEAVAFP